MRRPGTYVVKTADTPDELEHVLNTGHREGLSILHVLINPNPVDGQVYTVVFFYE
jgi:hypothetical protein